LKNFFSKIFGQATVFNDPDIQMGRYSDVQKTPEQYEHWDKAIVCFDQEKYIQSYTHVLEYLKNDHQNIDYKLNQGILQFTMLQGSKLIEGEANFKKFRGVAKIAKIEKMSLPMMRMLLEQNFNLIYSKYSIDDKGHVCITFDTYVEDSSPHKLYEALKELSTEADHKDDLLMSMFDALQPLDLKVTRQIDHSEKAIKYEYLQQILRGVLDQVEKGPLRPQEYPGAVSFVLLDALYKVDFHLKPEGVIKEAIYNCHSLYFNDTVTPVFDKNRIIIQKIHDILNRTPEQVYLELYEVNATFGTAKPEGNAMLNSIVDAQRKDLQWYSNNGHSAYVEAICGYVVGYALYSYSLPKPSKDLLRFFYRIVESPFYSALGFKPDYGIINKDISSVVKDAVERITQTWVGKYKEAKVNVDLLKYGSKEDFCISYMDFISSIQYPS
jgi:hypothetical protein